jgi:hypothetical protein
MYNTNKSNLSKRELKLIVGEISNYLKILDQIKNLISLYYKNNQTMRRIDDDVVHMYPQ